MSVHSQTWREYDRSGPGYETQTEFFDLSGLSFGRENPSVSNSFIESRSTYLKTDTESMSGSDDEMPLSPRIRPTRPAPDLPLVAQVAKPALRERSGTQSIFTAVEVKQREFNPRDLTIKRHSLYLNDSMNEHEK